MEDTITNSKYFSNLAPFRVRGAGIALVECPRDAMQGWKYFIATPDKIAYLNQLLKVGFHTLDCGSFVSPKAIPQMADTAEVIEQLDLSGTNTKLLVIVANERGAKEAVSHSKISYLGYPFSVSPTFQQRNANSSIEESLDRVKVIQQLCIDNGKELVLYLSMAFGNPYGDAYSPAIVAEWANQLQTLGINIISLADTVGLASPVQVFELTSKVIQSLPNSNIGVHLHSTKHNWKEKMEAALAAGCKRFDGALKGIGGCPMANNELVGNMDSELMIAHLKQLQLLNELNETELAKAITMATDIFHK